MAEGYRRRRFVLQSGLQTRLTLGFMVVMTCVANLIALMSFTLITQDMDRMLDEATPSVDPTERLDNLFAGVVKPILPKLILTEAAILVLTFCLCVWFTQRIAGPLHRMQRVTREIGEGDLTQVVMLRPSDELKELADSINLMTTGLSGRVRRLNEVVQGLEQTRGAEAGLEPLKAILAEFKVEGRA